MMHAAKEVGLSNVGPGEALPAHGNLNAAARFLDLVPAPAAGPARSDYGIENGSRLGIRLARVSGWNGSYIACADVPPFPRAQENRCKSIAIYDKAHKYSSLQRIV